MGDFGGIKFDRSSLGRTIRGTSIMRSAGLGVHVPVFTALSQ
jgi:hypothetical protein